MGAITADAGGSNNYRSHVWKHQLQRVADKLDMSIHVSNFPPGTSKWNRVEHCLFSFISINWRGRPRRSQALSSRSLRDVAPGVGKVLQWLTGSSERA